MNLSNASTDVYFSLFLADQCDATAATPTPGSVLKVSPSGSSVSTLVGGLDGPFGLAFDNENKDLYVASYGVGSPLPLKISVIAADGSVSPFSSQKIPAQTSLAFDSAGSLYVSSTLNYVPNSNGPSNTKASIYRFPAGHSDDQPEIICSFEGWSTPGALAVLASGDVVVVLHGDSAHDGNIAVLRTDGKPKPTYTSEILPTKVKNPTDVVIVKKVGGGEELYVSQQVSPCIFLLSPDSGKLTPVIEEVDGDGGVTSFCLAPDGNFYAIGSFGKTLFKVAADGRDPTPIYTSKKLTGRRVRYRMES